MDDYPDLFRQIFVKFWRIVWIDPVILISKLIEIQYIDLKWSFWFWNSLQTYVYFSGNSLRNRNPRRGDHIRNTRIAYACEDSTMHLNCTSQHGVIRIIRANYGRFVLSTCNPWSVTTGWDLQCSSRDSYRIVAERYILVIIVSLMFHCFNILSQDLQ